MFDATMQDLNARSNVRYTWIIREKIVTHSDVRKNRFIPMPQYLHHYEEK